MLQTKYNCWNQHSGEIDLNLTEWYNLELHINGVDFLWHKPWSLFHYFILDDIPPLFTGINNAAFLSLLFHGLVHSTCHLKKAITNTASHQFNIGSILWSNLIYILASLHLNSESIISFGVWIIFSLQKHLKIIWCLNQV